MGKNKYIETPEKMWELFIEYKKFVKDNPRYIYQLAQKLGEPVKVPMEVPLTMEGFSSFCYEKIGCVKHYFNNTDNRYNEYSTISSRIKEEIRQDQIVGGMVGQYNSSITARLNNLAETTNVTANLKTPIFGENPLDNKDNE
jgi:hypothetical protein